MKLRLLTVLLVMSLGLGAAQAGESVFGPSDLSHYWPFEEGTGTVTADVVGGYDGILRSKEGTTATEFNGTTKKFGNYAVDFDGAGGAVELPATFPTEGPLENFTMVAWLRPTAYVSSGGTYGGRVFGRDGEAWECYTYEANGNPNFKWSGSYGAPGFECTSSEDSLLLDTWTHFAVSLEYDAGLGEWVPDLYLNGVRDVAYIKNATSKPPAASRWIGNFGDAEWNSTNQWGFVGQMDDIAIFSRVLDPNEVAYVKDYGVAGLDLLAANTPSPADGGVDVSPTTSLGWQIGQDFYNPGSPSPYVTKYLVYLQTGAPDDPNLYLVETITDPGTTSHTPAVTLSKDTTYQWRVDQVLTEPNMITGKVWSFETELSLPEITGQPEDQIVFVGDPAVFTVVANDPLSGTLSYEWHGPAGVVGGDSPTLTIDPVELADEGTYYCKVTNAIGTIDSATAGLVLKRIIGHYEFEQSLNDTSGREEHGVYSPGCDGGTTDPCYVSGLVGDWALQLNGEELVKIGVEPDGVTDNGNWDDYRAGLTVSIWINYNESRYFGYWIGKGQNGAWWLTQNGWESTQICWKTGDYNDWIIASPGSLMGDWHHVVGTWDPVLDEARVYFDGELVGSPRTDADLPANDDLVTIGHMWYNGSLYCGANTYYRYKGLIDDVRLYNYPLTDLEVAAQYLTVTGGSLCVDPPEMDLNDDCRVDMEDLALLAGGWLECGLIPDCLP